MQPHSFDLESLNTDCACITLDRPALLAALTAEIGDATLSQRLAEQKPSLVSERPVYLSERHAAAMRATIAAAEAVAKLPNYRDAVLAGAPAIAQADRGTAGVFMGYDFHIGPDGPRLIEINTNAGGALINAFLLEAQRACCTAIENAMPAGPGLVELGRAFVDSFVNEWHGAGRQGNPRRIAIVDERPAEQYLHEEFVLFEQLFRRHGIAAVIADPADLRFAGDVLTVGGEPIDLVYNRLTDFALAGPALAVLKSAFEQGRVVLTPDPHAHALFANKRNLAILGDPQRLAELGVDATLIATLRHGVPATRVVARAAAADLWANRKTLFFKPASGYGGKAAYRGDKLTKAVFASILEGDYVAQAIVPPSTRAIVIDGVRQALKLDLRCYTYAGATLLLAARLYQGQTTNFRTPGGGWAPVFTERFGAAGACSSGACTSANATSP